MRLSTLVVVLTAAIANLYLWGVGNQPVEPDESRYPVMSLSYNPYQQNQSPFYDDLPSQSELQADLDILATHTRSIRLYSSSEFLTTIPAMARKLGMSVIASAWLGDEPQRNRLEVEAAIKLAGHNRNVTRLIIGNETQLTEIVPLEELEGYLSAARKRLRTPVSTAEPWDYWLDHPELVQKVDFIAIHILPYWVEVPIENAVDYVFEKYNAVKAAYPYKMVIIAETGWPSDGPQKGGAVASLANQAYFVREFVRRAEAAKVVYNVIEAFDQPWKSTLEGRAGEHWGIMDADRLDKFPLAGPVLNDPDWQYWASSSAVIGILSMLLFFVRRRGLTLSGRLFSALIIQVAASAAAQLAREMAGEYMSPGDIAFWTIMLTAQALLAIIFLSDAFEIADVVGKKPLRRRYAPAARLDDSEYPLVSVHVACCKEPPAMVIATIDSLARLDYPRFEVIVVDNNTPDESLWRPVEQRCRELGRRFRFYSLGSCPGYKAGALNFALSVTNPEAKAVGVVDADYVVEPDWLAAALPYFAEDDVAVVQAPQEHRAWEQNMFQRMENDEYSGFFRIGMVQRNEDNAIIQHGTMTLIDRASLDRLGGWAEWCICEDAELGLRLLLQGKRAIYIDHAFGRGLVPDSYEAYAKQRFRWAYGGMRIMRRYWAELLGLRGRLSFAQRYQFIKGWLPWIGDGLHMIFTLAALVWCGFLLYDPLATEFPEPVFIYPALALVALRILGTFWTYAARVKIGSERTILAMVAGGSLTHSIAKAVFQGLFVPGKPFYRTPKMDEAPPLLRSVVIAWQEIVLALALNGCAIAIMLVFGSPNDQAVLWSIALVTQSFPYITAIAAAMASSLSGRRTPPQGALPLLPAESDTRIPADGPADGLDQRPDSAGLMAVSISAHTR